MISGSPQQRSLPPWRGLLTPAVLRGAKATAFVLMAAAFALALVSQSEALRNYRWSIEPGWLLAAALVALVRGIFIVYPWWRTVQSWSAGANLGFLRAARIYYHSGLARYVPGQWWFVPARAVLAEGAGVRKVVTVAGTAVETAMAVGTALSVAALGSATLGTLPGPVRWLLLAAGLAIPVALPLSPGLLARAVNKLLKMRGYAPIDTLLAPRTIAQVMIGCYLDWVMFGAMAALLLVGVGGAITWADSAAVVGLFAASVLGGSVGLVLPQGMLLREGVLVTLLHISLGVPVPAAIAAAALTRLVALLAEGTWALGTARF